MSEEQKDLEAWSWVVYTAIISLLVCAAIILTDNHAFTRGAERIVKRFPEVKAICESPLTQAQKAAAVEQLMKELEESR